MKRKKSIPLSVFYDHDPDPKKRGEGAVVVLQNEKVVKTIGPIYDDPMGKHLQRAAQYLSDNEPVNPCNVEMGLEVVRLMHLIVNGK
jgi:hypothetical protein